MQLTAISVLLGKPFDVSTDFCLQYQFHSESITDNEKVELVKELVRMLKLEDHSDHKNWETPEANGYANGYELRSEYVIDMLKQLFQQLQTAQFREERVVEQFAGDSCKALVNRDDTEDSMYAGVCAFRDAKKEAFEGNTVDATYEDGNASTHGGGDFDGVCFSLVPDVVWQCFPEHLQNELYSATPRSDGLYIGTYVFEASELYGNAEDASAFQAREPLMFLEQSHESDDDEDPSYVPRVADESRERRMRRQPSQPLNPLLPECTDLSSFKHKYTDEESEETVSHGQCDTQEASNMVQVLTPATVTKFAHYQRHKGWCDTELTSKELDVYRIEVSPQTPGQSAEAASLITSFSTMSNEPDPLNYETPEVNAYKFHSSGIIDMLEKLQNEA